MSACECWAATRPEEDLTILCERTASRVDIETQCAELYYPTYEPDIGAYLGCVREQERRQSDCMARVGCEAEYSECDLDDPDEIQELCGLTDVIATRLSAYEEAVEECMEDSFEPEPEVDAPECPEASTSSVSERAFVVDGETPSAGYWVYHVSDSGSFVQFRRGTLYAFTAPRAGTYRFGMELVELYRDEGEWGYDVVLSSSLSILTGCPGAPGDASSFPETDEELDALVTSRPSLQLVPGSYGTERAPFVLEEGETIYLLANAADDYETFAAGVVQISRD